MLGRWVTSIPSSPSVSSASLSVAWRSTLRSGGTQPAHQRLQGQNVALGSEARHHPSRQTRDNGVPPLRLPGEDIRQMKLYEGNLDRQQGVAERKTRMGKGRCVYQRAVSLAF